MILAKVQKGCVSDGPGIRTVVFLKGCSLKCPWCCNPESYSTEGYWIDNEKCLLLKGIESPFCNNCVRVGGNQLEHECRFGVSTPTYDNYTIDTLVDTVLKERPLFEQSGGGVTLSGGEPTLNKVVFDDLVRQIKNRGVTVYVETSLYTIDLRLLNTLDVVDGWFVDLKLQPEMFLKNEHYMKVVGDNLKFISNVYYRLVVVDTLCDHKEVLLNNLRRLNVQTLELLKCHNLAQSKYKKLGMDNADYSASKSAFDELKRYIQKEGIIISDLKV